MKIALNAGLIARQMYTHLESEHQVVVQKGITNTRAVLRLRVKLLRAEVQPAMLTRQNLQSLREVLHEFGKE